MSKSRQIAIPFTFLLLCLLMAAPLPEAAARGRSGLRQDPRVPTLVFPKTNATFSIPHAGRQAWMFEWRPVRGATAYHLEVHAARIRAPMLKRRLTGTNYVHIVSAGYAPGAGEKGWNWRVRAIWGSRVGAWSTWGAFTAKRMKKPMRLAPLRPIQPIDPNAPQPIGPLVPISPRQPIHPIQPINPNAPEPIVPGPQQPSVPKGGLDLRVLPQLQTPVAGATLPNADDRNLTRWTFRWSAVPGAVKYRIQIRRRGAGIALIDTFVPNATYTYLSRSGYFVEANLRGWTWRVQTLGLSGQRGRWTAFRAFDIRTRRQTLPRIDPQNVPTVPALVSPAAGAHVRNADAAGILTWRFRWIGLLAAQRYQIQVRKQGASLNLLDATTTGMNYVHRSEGYIAEANLTGWQWRVRGLGQNGPVGRWTAWRTFSVAAR